MFPWWFSMLEDYNFEALSTSEMIPFLLSSPKQIQHIAMLFFWEFPHFIVKEWVGYK